MLADLIDLLAAAAVVLAALGWLVRRRAGIGAGCGDACAEACEGAQAAAAPGQPGGGSAPARVPLESLSLGRRVRG